MLTGFFFLTSQNYLHRYFHTAACSPAWCRPVPEPECISKRERFLGNLEAAGAGQFQEEVTKAKQREAHVDEDGGDEVEMLNVPHSMRNCSILFH